MIITLEEDELLLLVRKGVERKEIPFPEGYIIRDITVAYNEDITRIGVEVHLELEGADEQTGLVAR